MVWDKRQFLSTAMVFLFLAHFAFAEEDTYWDQYKFDAKGHFELVGTTHDPQPNRNSESITCTFDSESGSASGTCIFQTERESGRDSGSVKWNPPPATANENQPYQITVDMESETSGVYYGFSRVGLGVDSGVGMCTSFHDIGTPFAIARGYANMDSGGSASKTINYRFPSFYKPWICNYQGNPETDSADGGATMRREALKKDTYYFNMTIYVETSGGKDTYTYTYKWVPGGEAGGDISGRITDGHGDPMPYANVTLEFLGKNYATNADGAGSYKISSVEGFSPDKDNPPNGVITAFANYWRDGENFFALYDAVDGNKMVVLQKKFLLKDDSDKMQDIDFNINVPAGIYSLKHGDAGADKVKWLKEGEEIASASQLSNLFHLAPVYYYTANALDFDLSILEANISYKLPVDVFAGGNGGTKYTRPDSSIYIDFGDLAYNSADRPRNREYHEFAHHLLFSQWNGEGLRVGADTNHGGFINSNTGDSYTEGFAEFMSLVIADYTPNPNDPQPSDIYAGFGSLENNLKPWERWGTTEELAVAGVLWDIYDKANDDGDTVSISVQKLWPVLKVKRANFYEYAQALKGAFPENAAGIDKILLAHGFFADSFVGNKVRDAFEPYIDANNNNAYDAGEKFIDYGINASHPAIVYDGKGEIGRATNYERPSRGKAVEIPGAFLSVPDARVSLYEISVHFNKPSQGKDYTYVANQKEGKIYVQPLPEGADATISIKPKSAAYSGKTYAITNADYNRKFYAKSNSGTFDSFDFALKATGKSEPATPQFSGGAMRWGTDAGNDEAGGARGSVSLPLSGGNLPILPCFAAVAIVAGAGFFAWKKIGGKKNDGAKSPASAGGQNAAKETKSPPKDAKPNSPGADAPEKPSEKKPKGK